MPLYKQKKSQFWWTKFYTAEGACVRKSTGTDDRDNAALIEQTLMRAYGTKTPTATLHAMIDSIRETKKPATHVSEIWDLYSQWLKATSKNTAAVTLRKRKNATDRLLKWLKENWPSAKHVENVDRQIAAAFAADLAEDGTKGKTRRNIIGDLGTIWEALKRVRDDVINPWPLVRPEANDSERGVPFTREQVAAVLAAAEAYGGGWHLASLIARYTGLRYSSIARLAWADIDLEKGVIHHTPQKTARHNIRVHMPMVPALRDALQAAWECREEPVQRRAARSQAIIKPLDAGYVLPLHAAYYPRPEMAGGPGAFLDVLTLAKITDTRLTFHSWRHTFRTRLSEAGVSDDLAKRLGGWTEDATAARYDHAERIAELREAIEKAG
jgi:integrase